MFFRYLGMIAAFDRRLSRIRISIIPMNLIVVSGLGILTSKSMADVVRNGLDANLPLALVVMALFLSIVTVQLRRHTIFRAHSNELLDDPITVPSGPVDLRFTGTLTLNDRVSQRFVEVPAESTLSSGDIAFFSKIDASNRWMGIKYDDRLGEWTAVIPAGRIARITRGELAFGGDVRPAVRLQISEQPRGRSRSAFVSFGSWDQRDYVVDTWTRASGRSSPSGT